MEKIGLALVGSTGAIGNTHIEGIEEASSAKLIGVNARRQEPLTRQAAELEVHAYPKLDDLLGSSEVDAVIIATPQPSHLEIALRAIKAGKHVLVEKPLSVTPSEADQMVTAARDANLKLGVLFNNRFRPEAQKMRQLLDQGVIGKLYRASMVSGMFRTQNYYDSLAWRGTWKHEGGGALINQGIHAIDMFQWLSGMPKSCYGVLRTLKHNIEVEDYATAILEYEGGMTGTLSCDTVQAPNKQRIELYGEYGALIMEDWNVTLYSLEMPLQEFMDTDKTKQSISSQNSISLASPTHISEDFNIQPINNTHGPAIEDFCRAIIEGREPLINGEEGTKAQELVAAITLSGCSGEKVSVPVDRQQYDNLILELKSVQSLVSNFPG